MPAAQSENRVQLRVVAAATGRNRAEREVVCQRYERARRLRVRGRAVTTPGLRGCIRDRDVGSYAATPEVVQRVRKLDPHAARIDVRNVRIEVLLIARQIAEVR